MPVRRDFTVTTKVGFHGGDVNADAQYRVFTNNIGRANNY
jgi:hypothetical protein